MFRLLILSLSNDETNERMRTALDVVYCRHNIRVRLQLYRERWDDAVDQSDVESVVNGTATGSGRRFRWGGSSEAVVDGRWIPWWRRCLIRCICWGLSLDRTPVDLCSLSYVDRLDVDRWRSTMASISIEGWWLMDDPGGGADAAVVALVGRRLMVMRWRSSDGETFV